MRKENNHKNFMTFVTRLTAVAADYGREDMNLFLQDARHGFPSIIPVIKGYLQMLDKEWGPGKRILNESFAPHLKSETSSSSTESMEIGSAVKETHLFDLLRSKELFPLNRDLADFAARVLPGMTKRRFDKMSRGDIAARIIEYIETRQHRKRYLLEDSMRNAIYAISKGAGDKPQSFFDKWEKIIKGIEL